MNDYKHAYDALVAQQDVVLELAARIEARFEAGDADGALELESELDEAQQKRAALAAIYDKLVNIGTAAPQIYFAPAADPDPAGDMTQVDRAAFQTLTPKARAEFLKSGGVVID